MNVHKSLTNPEGLCEDGSLQGRGKEFAVAPGLGFAPMGDCGHPIASARWTKRGRASSAMRMYGFQAVRAILLATVFAASNPLPMNSGQVHAREFDSTSAVPMTGGSWPRLASGLQVEGQFMSLSGVTAQSAEPQAPAQPDAPEARPLDDINEYLWSVYQRAGAKRDSSGDFTWKDAAAAARLGLLTREYVIGGMDPDFRELLFDLGHAMDAAGINWTILSAFRDDYRQSLAAGFKAHGGNSFHGGSRATGGFGHGCAADLAGSDGPDSSDTVWKWLDQHGGQFGVHRPMRQNDPAHMQPFGTWHEVAAELRDKRVGIRQAYLPSSTANTDAGAPVSRLLASHSSVSEAQFECVRHRPAEHLRTARLGHFLRLAGLERSRTARLGRSRMARLEHFRNGRLGHVRMAVLEHSITPELEHLRTAEPELSRTAGTEHSRTAEPDHSRTPGTEHSRTAGSEHSRTAKPEPFRLAGLEHSRTAEPENHLKPRIAHVLNTDQPHRNAKWRRVVDIRSLQQRPGGERRHARSKTRLHVAGRNSCSGTDCG